MRSIKNRKIATAIWDNLKHFNLAGTKLVILQGMNNDAMDIGSIKAQVMEDFIRIVKSVYWSSRKN